MATGRGIKIIPKPALPAFQFVGNFWASNRILGHCVPSGPGWVPWLRPLGMVTPVRSAPSAAPFAAASPIFTTTAVPSATQLLLGGVGVPYHCFWQQRQHTNSSTNNSGNLHRAATALCSPLSTTPVVVGTVGLRASCR